MRRPPPLLQTARICPTIVAALVCATPIAALAQFPNYRLDHVLPAGGRAGEVVEVEVSGLDLESASGLWFDHPGLSAESIEGDNATSKFRVSIADGTPTGLHDVRVLGPLGVSNPRVFVVGPRPETSEQEPNDRPEAAEPIVRGRVVNGRINGATDLDGFTFQGRAGERILVDVDADRLDAPLDAEARLFDDRGVELAYSHDGNDRDPSFEAILPDDGRYRIEVRDVVFGGSPDFVYRLLLHGGPRVDSLTPRAAIPGSSATFNLVGRGFEGDSSAETGPDDPGAETRSVAIDVPDDLDPDPNAPGRAMSPAAGLRGVWWTFQGDRGEAEPVFIAEALSPVVVGVEPGGSAHEWIAPPCDLSADFEPVDDVDAYRFHASRGDAWSIEVFAERIGSPVDATLRLQRVRDDGTLDFIAEADDQAVPEAIGRFDLNSVDPALRVEIPEDGLYQITVGDLYNARVPDPSSFYRLVVRPPAPGFRLVALPGEADRPSGINVRAGGRVEAHVIAQRLDGFEGPIRVMADSMPPGITAEPVLIGPGQVGAPIVLTAATDAPEGHGTIRLVGEAVADDASISTSSPALDGGAEAVAVAGTLIAPKAGDDAPAFARVARGQVVAVRPGAPFRLSAAPDRIEVRQGDAFAINARVDRHSGFAGAVTLSADFLPSKAEASSATIAPEQMTAPVMFTIANEVAPGVYTLLLRGASKAMFTPTDASEAEEIDVAAPSNTVTLIVRNRP